MKNLKPLEIAEEVKRLTKIDIYKNSRSREHVEHRALVCWLLRDKLQMRWLNIADLFKKKGKTMEYSTAMHLVKMYPKYREGNEKLKQLEKKFFFSTNVPFDEIDKIKYLESKCSTLEVDYLKIQEKLRSPLVSLVLDVPTHRTQELKSKIKAIKNTWLKNIK